MRLFGLEITKAQPGVLHSVSENHGGWRSWLRIHEPYTGAWQHNVEWTTESVLSNPTVFACVTLISQDIGKLRPKLVELDGGIWTETEKPSPFAPVLRKPNNYQNYIQFKEWWTTSKLLHGNTYVLKERDRRGVVTRLHVLDPSKVTPKVALDGTVYYELRRDNLSGQQLETVTVPATEIIHDRMNCFFHPLVGLSPIFACGLSADMGLKIQQSSDAFFGTGANPSGVLTAPKTIDDSTAKRLKDHWDTQYSGANAGKIAVLGDGLSFQPMRMTSVDAQLVQQLRMTDEMICSAFHVPPFKVQIGPMPTYPNAAPSLNQIYYADCLQSLIESFELLMDDGLGIGEASALDGGKILGVELDLDSLFRMDEGTLMTTLGVGVGAGLVAPNEGRKRLSLKPAEGGESPYLQQQNFSLAALSERDKDKPFAKPTPAAPGSDATPANEEEESALAIAASASGFLMKELGMLHAA